MDHDKKAEHIDKARIRAEERLQRARAKVEDIERMIDKNQETIPYDDFWAEKVSARESELAERYDKAKEELEYLEEQYNDLYGHEYTDIII